jgi:hypothetical protein
MSKQKKTSAPKTHVIRTPLTPHKRQQASASTADKRKKFADVPMVQPTLFNLDQGGAQ